MVISAANLQDWVGREESAADVLGAATLERLWATLDRPDAPPREGDPLPPLAHWLYCLGAASRSQLGEDGHEMRGHFIPPITLPRRMWASSRLSFLRELRIGHPVRRVSRIASVTPKEGRTGALVFVTLEHEISDQGGPAIHEIQDVVYRQPGRPAGKLEKAGHNAQWSRTIRPDPVLLFRYSALTFNGHRIHYDHPYATGVEGYPGLVVHGPLIATLLVQFADDNVQGERVTGIDIRAHAPLFDNAPFTLNGRQVDHGAELWACDMDGGVAMEVTLRTGPQ
jgi:3-methylfumaryl-CoA hydratase